MSGALLTDFDFMRPSPLLETSDFDAHRKARPIPTHREEQNDSFARLLNYFNGSAPKSMETPVRAGPMRRAHVGQISLIDRPASIAEPKAAPKSNVKVTTLPKQRKALQHFNFKPLDLPAFRKPFGMGFQAV